jgi:putative ABC transport system permease protein
VPLAFLAGRSIASLLHGVSALDALSYAEAALLLLTVGGLAAYVPAHRAARIDPMAALRSE